MLEACNGQLIHLADDTNNSSSPAWSPDGNTIAFASLGDIEIQGHVVSLDQIYVIHAEGTGKRRLTFMPSVNTEPIWSFDGSRIAFISWGEGVYVMNRDGGELTALRKVECPDGRCSFYPHALSWSPDSTQLAVDVWQRGGAQYILILDTSDGSKARANGHQIANWSLNPTWSPDGSRLAYTCYKETLNPDICTIDVRTGKETRLTNKPGRDAKPIWSPDGTKLAFVSSRDGNWDIYSMNPDGSGQTNLTRNPSRDSEPAWSPDGQLIAFQSCRDDPHPLTCTSPCGDNVEEDDGIVSCSNEIYVMNADGSEQTRLTNSPDDDTFPAWAPR